MIKILKKYYVLISFIALLIGVFLDYASNKLEPSKKTMVHYDEQTGERLGTDTYFILRPEYQLLRLASNIMYTLSISLFISLVIIKRIEEEERKKLKSIEEEERKVYEKRLLDIQNAVNRDVLESIFQKFVDPSLFDILKKDVFSQSTIRKNAKWSYEITDNGEAYESLLTVTHEVHNNTSNDIEEKIKIELQSTDKDEAETEYLKLEDENKTTLMEEDFTDKKATENFSTFEHEFTIRANGYVTLTLIIKQVYLGYNVYDLLWATAATLGVEIEFNLPEDCSLDTSPTFSTKLSKRIDTETKVRFHNISAILPGQGIQFTLNKKTKPIKK